VEHQVIGEDQVPQRLAIAGQLLGAFNRIQRFADVLGLHVAHQQAVLEHGQVRRPALDAPGLVDGLNVVAKRATKRLKQGGQCRAVGVLGGIAGGEFVL